MLLYIAWIINFLYPPFVAIADDVDIREYILELKGQYGESHEIELEKPDEMGGHRPRR